MNNINWDIYKEEFTKRAQSIGKSEKYITENLNYAYKLFKKELPKDYETIKYEGVLENILEHLEKPKL